MSDWQKGDLALCVRSGARFMSRNGLRTKAGAVYTVVDVIPGVLWNDESIADAIALEGFIHSTRCGGVYSRRFRKITPGAKIEGIEEPRRLPVKERADA